MQQGEIKLFVPFFAEVYSHQRAMTYFVKTCYATKQQQIFFKHNSRSEYKKPIERSVQEKISNTSIRQSKKLEMEYEYVFKYEIKLVEN